MVFWRGCLHPYPGLSRDAGYLSSLVRQELKPKTKEKKRGVLFRRGTSRWNIRQSSWIAGRVGGLGQLPSIRKLRRTAVCKDELPEQGKGRKKKNPERVHSNFHWCFHETWKVQVSQTRTSLVLEGTVPYFQTYPSPAVTIYSIWKFICSITCQPTSWS